MRETGSEGSKHIEKQAEREVSYESRQAEKLVEREAGREKHAERKEKREKQFIDYKRQQASRGKIRQ